MEAINNLVDQVYYINLDSRPDRQFFIERRLSNFGIQSKRIPALNGKTWNGIISNFIKRHSKEWYHPSTTIPGYLTCTFSHWLALQDALENGYETILLLEDDAILHKNFDYHFNQIFEEIRERKIEWDIIYLGHYSRTFSFLTNNEEYSLKNIELKPQLLFSSNELNLRPWGNHCVLYSNRNGIFNEIINDYSLNIPSLGVSDQYNIEQDFTHKERNHFCCFPQLALQTISKCSIYENEKMGDFSNSFSSAGGAFTQDGVEISNSSLNYKYIDLEKDFII